MPIGIIAFNHFKHKTMRNLFIISFLLILVNTLQAQQNQPQYVQGEVLVRLPDGKGIEGILQDLRIINGKASRLQSIKKISQHLNIWQLSFDHNAISHTDILEQLWLHPNVRAAQNNHLITYRNTTPNDALYNQQWQYNNTGGGGATANADIDAPEAWDVTQGGNTSLGDTIVVCVIDDGLDPSHTDFAGNMWFNHAEIPNNGIDDDNNGYTDDYKGWNADDNDDDISGGTWGGGHGTSVAGIVGARGNNGIGVAGVNWYVKLMIVVGGGNEAQALEAYEYPLTQRKRYNQTNGAQGAFVVSTNASWGIDNLQWTNAPLWCAFYDTLGAAGILNAGATTNNESNVDVVGDMPTSCPSDYLISVTNLDDTGNKNTPAGYGLTTVDLGAFGEGTYTTEDGNTYGGFGGTSGATPHVAGTIALLYSVPCPRLAALAKADPAAAALQVRDFILGSVKPNNDLQGITVTGGTLNLKNAVDAVQNWGCAMSGCHEPFGTSSTSITGTNASLRWWGVALASSYTVNYRAEGASSWNTMVTIDTFATLSGLTACTKYEVEIAADCDTAVSALSNTFRFTTGDCCYAPVTITENAVNQTDANFSWNTDANVNSYTIEYKTLSAATWTTVTVATNNVALSNLIPCTEYELRIISTCNINVNNEYSAIVPFKTKGCGACEDATYCSLAGGDASYEWISNVTLGTLDNTSASDGGYGDYTGGTAPQLLRGSTNNYLSLTVSRTMPSTVNWRVWIDYNQNGTFETTEKVLETLSFSGTTTGDSVDVPMAATLGITRMRVAMRYSQSPAECGTFGYGEVEDYCVNIVDSLTSALQTPVNNWSSVVYPNPFDQNVTIQLHAQDIHNAVVTLENTAGQTILVQNMLLQTGGNTFTLYPNRDLPSGVYFLRIQLDNGQQRVHKLVK